MSRAPQRAASLESDLVQVEGAPRINAHLLFTAGTDRIAVLLAAGDHRSRSRVILGNHCGRHVLPPLGCGCCSASGAPAAPLRSDHISPVPSQGLKNHMLTALRAGNTARQTSSCELRDRCSLLCSWLPNASEVRCKMVYQGIKRHKSATATL